jgi:hypothetical protein
MDAGLGSYEIRGLFVRNQASIDSLRQAYVEISTDLRRLRALIENNHLEILRLNDALIKLERLSVPSDTSPLPVSTDSQSTAQVPRLWH